MEEDKAKQIPRPPPRVPRSPQSVQQLTQQASLKLPPVIPPTGVPPQAISCSQNRCQGHGRQLHIDRLGPMWKNESLGSASCAERISSQNGGSISPTGYNKNQIVDPPTRISNTSLSATAPAVESTVLAAPMPMGTTNAQNLCHRNGGESTLSDPGAAAKPDGDIQSSKNVKAGLQQIQQRGHLLMDQGSHIHTNCHPTKSGQRPMEADTGRPQMTCPSIALGCHPWLARNKGSAIAACI